ncbi:hypothetical protein [Coleofasciculus sp. E2-BRE-01]
MASPNPEQCTITPPASSAPTFLKSFAILVVETFAWSRFRAFLTDPKF